MKMNQNLNLTEKKYCDNCHKKLKYYEINDFTEGYTVYTTDGVKRICYKCYSYYSVHDKLKK